MYKTFTEDDQLRLLLIEPGHGRLKCRLIHTRLSNPSHSYESISYAWGHHDMHQDIETPDGPLSVPRTLHDALIHLRDPAKPRYVWADRACTNHADEKERSHQARLMRLIFKRAERVVIWLGADPRKRASMAFAVLCGVASGGEANGRPVGQANFYVDGASSANLPDVPCRDGPPPASFKMFWSAVAEMFALGWFWNVGCIQEVRPLPAKLPFVLIAGQVAAARSADVLWGNARISWKWVGLAAARIRNSLPSVLQQYDIRGVFNAYLMYRLCQSQDFQVAPLRLSFRRLLGLTSHFTSRDPRDRVYGLIGIDTADAEPDKGRFFVEPDYSFTPVALYTKLAERVITVEESLSALGSVERGDVLDSCFPSWVPTWDKEFTRPLAGNGPNEPSLSGSFAIIDRGILQLYGLKVATVNTALSTVRHHDEDIIRFDKSLNSNRRFLALFENAEGDHRRRKLCWTLTAGKSWNGIPSDNPEQHIADFEYYFRHTGQGKPKWKDPLEQHKPDWRRFARATANAAMNRKLFFTEDDDVGLGPAAMERHDEVWVVAGGSLSLVLRPAGDEQHRLVGECYVLSVQGLVAQWRNGNVAEGMLDECSSIFLI